MAFSQLKEHLTDIFQNFILIICQSGGGQAPTLPNRVNPPSSIETPPSPSPPPAHQDGERLCIHWANMSPNNISPTTINVLADLFIGQSMSPNVTRVHDRCPVGQLYLDLGSECAHRFVIDSQFCTCTRTMT